MAKKTTRQPILDQDSRDFLFSYLNNFSPTGNETAGQVMWKKYLEPFADAWHTDYYGNTTAILNPDEKFRVVIEAHADEISWMVNYINEDGLISVIRNGGSDQQIAASKRVNIFTSKGIVKGFFGWPAIHVREKENEKAPKVEGLFVDVGCDSKEEVQNLGVEIGDLMVFEDQMIELNNKYFVGRALDNRIGGFMIAQVFRLIKQSKKKLPFGLYAVNAVQEEVGLRGAQMAVQNIKPNIAIVTDVCHDTTTPGINKKIEGDLRCGRGPVLTIGPAIHQKVLRLVMDTAQNANIPFQRNPASRGTGTDTDAFAYGNGGTPSVLISLPLKYMHTTVETAAITDVENCIHLMFEALLAIQPDMDLKYL